MRGWGHLDETTGRKIARREIAAKRGEVSVENARRMSSVDYDRLADAIVAAQKRAEAKPEKPESEKRALR